MRERGRYQIQLMKTRSSSGVGSKIDLGFDIDSLRIIDLGEDDTDYNTPSSSIINSLKRSTSQEVSPEFSEDPNEGAPVGRIRAKTDSTKLREFLNNLGDE